AQNGLNNDVGLLVNSSRGIIYASQEEDFAEAAATAAKTLQEEMAVLLKEKNLI
ncbi:MAG: orotidine 5'-phosphate decarboxylase, partial [Flavobacteriaceae bacterium]